MEIPEWGGTLRVQSLTGAERDIFETSVMIGKGKNRDVNTKNIRSKLVIMAVVGEDGQKIFSPEDIEALGQKNAAALDRVFSVAQELSGLRPQDLDELAKNSETVLNEDSISD